MSSSEEESAGFLIPPLNKCKHTRYFCEENIWQLAKYVLNTNKTTSGLKCYVIVMSNPEKNVHLWHQDISIYESYCYDQSVNKGLIFWDYHVFLITEYYNQTLVFDYNSTLTFPVDFSKYASEAVKHDFEIRRYFKVIEAETYIRKFSSDRRHMRTSSGTWLKAPPPYEPILNEEKEHNVETLINMEEASDEFGEVLNVEEFVARFTRPKE